MIAKLTENLFLSGSDEVLRVERLNRMGITAVLNLAYQVSDPHHKDLIMIKIGLREFETNPDFLKRMAVDVIAKCIDSGHKVLVHCHAGAHRSPFIAMSYLAEKSNRTLDEVYKEYLPKIPWGVVYPPNILFA